MKFLAAGNAICDIICQVEDEFLAKHQLAKASMQLCDDQKSAAILADLASDEKLIASGGSAANTANYLSAYGLEVGFIGNVADGFYGRKFKTDLDKNNINFFNTHQEDDAVSAKSVILVTPDGERTMCTSLGCAATLHQSQLDLTALAQADLFYIEGYLWDQQGTNQLILALCQQVKASGGNNVFSLADAFCVKRHLEDFKKLCVEHIDIVFGNESEFQALFAKEVLDQKALEEIQAVLPELNVELMIITLSGAGVVLITEQRIITVATTKLQAVDTTGAGDSFAAGFLYGYLQEMSLKDAAKLGNYLAGQVIMNLGARPEINLITDPASIPHAAA